MNHSDLLHSYAWVDLKKIFRSQENWSHESWSRESWFRASWFWEMTPNVQTPPYYRHVSSPCVWKLSYGRVVTIMIQVSQVMGVYSVFVACVCGARTRVCCVYTKLTFFTLSHADHMHDKPVGRKVIGEDDCVGCCTCKGRSCVFSTGKTDGSDVLLYL